MLKRRRLQIALAMIVAITLLIGSNVNAAINNRTKTLIRQKIAPAYIGEDTETSTRLLENLLQRLDADEVLEVDEILAEEGVPGMGEMMLDARFQQVVARGLNPQKIKPREVALSMPVLKSRFEELMAEVQELDCFAEELPQYATIREYEDAFWEIHVASNKLQNAVRMTKYGDKLVNTALDKNLKDLSDDEIEQLEIDFGSLRQQLEDLNWELAEIKAELRINAVTLATEIVRESADFKERLRAAYVINFDGQQAVDFLRETEKEKLSRPLLKDPNILDSVMVSVNHARESAGDVATKSRLLYLGMHWWLRGRYGEGPEGFGLLKSAAALNSPMARFPLYMPAKPPKPTAPGSGSQATPRFDRRHHYIWMYEYRQFNEQQRTNSTTTIDKPETFRVTSRTKLSRFY